MSLHRPKTKFAKVTFSQVSVCPRGGGWSLSGKPPVPSSYSYVQAVSILLECILVYCVKGWASLQGKFECFKSATSLKRLWFIFHFFGGWEGGKGGRRRHQHDLPLRPASSWWTTRVSKEAIWSGSVVKTKMCCALDWKLVAEKNSLKIPTATSTKLPN